MRKYHQIRASIDPKIIGRSESPISVEITNKIFTEQRTKYALDVNKYFEDFQHLYSYFPKGLTGKMYQRKKDPIDIMQVIPFYMSLRFAVSEKVKAILEELQVNKAEYHLEKFIIDGSNDNFYFLFIPLLKNSEYIDYEKTIYYDGLNDKYAVFDTYETYLRGSGNFSAKTLYVKSVLESRDIISLQGAGPFYSERIIEAFKKENIVGYDIITKGDFKIDLNFI